MPSAIDYERVLTHEEAQAGVYLAFTGRTGEPPALGGILCRGSFDQVVFDPQLKLAAEGAAHRRVTAEAFEPFCVALLERCRREGRRLIALTHAERTEIRQWARVDVGDVYAQGGTLAAWWRDSRHPDAPRTDDLRSFGALFGVAYPRHFGTRKTRARLKYVRDRAAVAEKRGRGYAGYSKAAKWKWTTLLAHNRWRCETLRLVLRRVTADPAAG